MRAPHRNTYIRSENGLYHLSTARGRASVNREIGAVLAITPTGALTVRAPDGSLTPEGTLVCDSRGRFRGRVVRVFGPAERPYLTVRLRRAISPEEALGLLGRPMLREGTDREAQ